MTKQMQEWAETFGREYTDRNAMDVNEMESLYQKTYGITRTQLNEQFIQSLDRSMRILEIGSNIGNQLLCLQKMGFEHLYGIELQPYAVEISKQKTKGINLMQGSAFDVPFKDSYFDLVFTSGVLIHIAPADIAKAINEIHRVSKEYIWGFEYWAPEYTEVNYRGQDGLLWKTDFAKLYLQTFQDLELEKEKKIPYLNQDLSDSMYLLKKKVSRKGEKP